jgi:uncharacterized protein YjbI with pentapeptide repeats
MAVLPDPGRSRAVLIGASTYRHLEDLPAVRNNLPGFREVLIAPALGGLPADNCTVVAEPARPVDVYRTLRQQAAAAEDTLLVYFAGHGRTGSRNELFLCLPDTDPDELPYSAWPYDELRRVVADSPATKKVVILDCCFSGRALADQAGDEETILGQVGIEGTYLLTATAANRVALAPPGERYTAFTGTLLGLLHEGIPDGPELLTFGQIYPRLQYAPTSRQLPRPHQQGSDTIAHLALTRNLAYTRRGETEVFNERFTAITAQLDHEMSAPRLAGVHAMADLADDWPENRQTCVDVLCAYLRRPYVRDPGQEAPEPERLAFEASREIRHTVIQVIAAHLRDGAAVSWQGLNFDLTGAVFDGGDFRGAEFSGGLVLFNDAVFSGGEVSFDGAVFSGGEVSSSSKLSFDGIVSFVGAVFSGGKVSFDGAVFSGGEVSCRDAKFSGAEVSFNGAVFSGGMLSCRSAEFSGGTVSFAHAKHSGGIVDFDFAVFSGAEVSFDGAVFSGGEVGCRGVKFSGGTVSFDGAVFSGGTVGFDRARFSGDTVSFRRAEFSRGTVSFRRVELDAGTVSFDAAVFSGAEVDFHRLQSFGGQIDFSGASRWSHPPMFSWDVKPPTWVALPVQPGEEKPGASSSEADEHRAEMHGSGARQ